MESRNCNQEVRKQNTAVLRNGRRNAQGKIV